MIYPSRSGEPPPCRRCRPPIFRKLALVAQLEIEAHRGVCAIRSGPALFEAFSQAGYNPELVLDLPDLGDDIGSAAFICLTPLLPPLHRRSRRIFELQPIRGSGRSDSASPTAWRRCLPKPIRGERAGARVFHRGAQATAGKCEAERKTSTTSASLTSGSTQFLMLGPRTLRHRAKQPQHAKLAESVAGWRHLARTGRVLYNIGSLSRLLAAYPDRCNVLPWSA
jgi:hypothetical protein